MFCLSHVCYKYKKNKYKDSDSCDMSDSESLWFKPFDGSPISQCNHNSIWFSYLSHFSHRNFSLEMHFTPFGDFDANVKQYRFIWDNTLSIRRIAILQKITSSSPHFLSFANEILCDLRHPYLLPLFHCDVFSHNFCVIIIPYCPEGNISQFFSKLHQNARTSNNLVYITHDKCIRRFSRQILIALTYLHEKGFQPFGHLHSNNVFIQNGTARLSGIENVFLRNKPRLKSIIHDCLQNSLYAIDTISFGHIFYEMIIGCKLTSLKPTLLQIKHLKALNVNLFSLFNNIFGLQNQDNFPLIEQILNIDYFIIDLRETQQNSKIFNNWIKRSEISECAIKFMKEISLKSQIFDRIDSNSSLNNSFELYITPPQSPLKLIANERIDYEYSAFEGSNHRKNPKPSSLMSSPKRFSRKPIRTQMFQDIRFGTKFHKSCDRL